MKRPYGAIVAVILATLATCIVIPVILWSRDENPTFSQGGPPAGESIVSGRPLSDLADELETRYRTVITYEEPLLIYRGDLEVTPALFGDKVFLGPKKRTFSLAVIDKIDLPTLESVIDAYNGQQGPPSFRVISSSYGLHIIPDSVRDAQGKIIVASRLLDTIISVPIAERTPWKTLAAICQAISNSTGARIVPSCPSLRPSYDGLFAAGGDPVLSWGAESVNARKALIELLSRSATTLSWRLNYAPSPDDRFYVLNVSPLLSPTGQEILYDRCSNCSNVKRPLAPLSRP